MAQQFVYVEDGKIVSGPRALPTSWRNISGLHLLSRPELIALGWLPVEDQNEPANSTAEVQTDVLLVIVGDACHRTYVKRGKTDAERTDEAAGEVDMKQMKAVVLGLIDALGEVGVTLNPATVRQKIIDRYKNL